MKILVCSDSHGNYSLLNKLYMMHPECDAFYHLGDSELPIYMLSNFLCVKGNCDYTDLDRYKDVKAKNFKIHLEHGDGYLFRRDPNNYILSLNVDIFLFGHTHCRLASKIGNTYIFNPGSLTRPRDGEYGTYLILDLHDDHTLTYEFKEVKGKEYED